MSVPRPRVGGSLLGALPAPRTGFAAAAAEAVACSFSASPISQESR